MASEKLSYEIAAIYSGSPAIKAAFDDFAKLNANGAKVVNQLQKMANQSKATGEQIRNTRQGTAQLGMQFNQFSTQIAGGTSPLLALQQQLGDVGYAMSFMKGSAGAVGNFLAGPWGALLIVAGSLVSSFLSTMDKGDEVSKSFQSAMKNAETALFNYKTETAATRQELLNLYETQLSGIEIKWREAATNVGQYGRQVQNAQQIMSGFGDISASKIATITAAIMSPTGGQNISTALLRVGDAYLTLRSASKDYQKSQEDEKNLYADMIGVQTTLARLKKGFANEDAAAAKRANSAAEQAARTEQSNLDRVQEFINKYTSVTEKSGAAQNALDDFNASVKGISSEHFKQLEAAINAVRLAIPLKEFKDLADSFDSKAIPDYVTNIDKLTTAFNNLSLAEQERQFISYDKALNAIGIKTLSNLISKYESYGQTVSEAAKDQKALNELIAAFEKSGVKLPSELKDTFLMLQDTIAVAADDEKFKKIRESFDSVGQSVSDGFKGMITGAQSFGDAMKNIIGSVIDELWKLFVVKQITGFISSGLSSMFGIPVSGQKAIGGPVQSGNAYLVGERGPEMFVPSRSGSIVPNGSIGSSNGMTINVDARGSADPAAVRAQVQQGILEAAPAIIAAAEQRTVSSLRRPRLGGVMQ